MASLAEGQQTHGEKAEHKHDKDEKANEEKSEAIKVDVELTPSITLDEHENPKNWTLARKWKAVFAISSFVLMSPLSSTIVAPGLEIISTDLNIMTPAEQTMVVSIFVLGFAFGPLIASPLSEIYGRVRVVQSWNLLYLIFNTGCGAANSKETLLVLRFISGFFGSATLGIGGGTLSDLFTADDRGKAVAIYSLAPLVGPVLGPIMGGLIAQHAHWSWVFYSASILDAVVQLLGILFLEETYAPVLLRRKQARLQITPAVTMVQAIRQVRDRLSANLGRAIRLLLTQPIVQVLALYNAFLYGIIFILYATFPELWTEIYHQSTSIAGLHYISMAVGTAFASEVCTHINDRIFASLKKKNGGTTKPEFRIPIMAPATVLLSVGLFWYGWSAQKKLHWIMPDIGSAFFMAGAVVCGICVNAYIIDTYGKYSASALAAVAILRSLAAFAFPLFAPYVYIALGYGWTGSLLGFCGLGIGLPAVLLLWKFGKALRRRSPFAANKEDD
ncbi:hypothetical protein MauCBS54593_006904 [Microsporum audouinii]